MLPRRVGGLTASCGEPIARVLGKPSGRTLPSLSDEPLSTVTFQMRQAVTQLREAMRPLGHSPQKLPDYRRFLKRLHIVISASMGAAVSAPKPTGTTCASMLGANASTCAL